MLKNKIPYKKLVRMYKKRENSNQMNNHQEFLHSLHKKVNQDKLERLKSN